MHSLLLGNGVNRAALQKDWTQLLHELAAQFDADELVHHLGSKPLSMFIEELCARSTGVFRHTEHAVKVAFAKLLEQITPMLIAGVPSSIHFFTPGKYRADHHNAG